MSKETFNLVLDFIISFLLFVGNLEYMTKDPTIIGTILLELCFMYSVIRTIREARKIGKGR